VRRWEILRSLPRNARHPENPGGRLGTPNGSRLDGIVLTRRTNRGDHSSEWLEIVRVPVDDMGHATDGEIQTALDEVLLKIGPITLGGISFTLETGAANLVE